MIYLAIIFCMNNSPGDVCMNTGALHSVEASLPALHILCAPVFGASGPYPLITRATSGVNDQSQHYHDPIL